MWMFYCYLFIGWAIMLDLSIPLRYGTRRLANVPWVFDALRWTLEGGFVAHRRLLKEHFSTAPDNVLDCGCGTGIFASCFPGQSYTGIDISRDYIQRAREQHRGYRFQVMDASSLQFPSESFEAVIVSGVLHHLESSLAKKVLSEVSRVLKPAGKLLMWEDVPTRNAWNVVGKLVHRLDAGEHIRPAFEYARLLDAQFQLVSARPMTSGCMDYIVLDARRK